VFSLPFFIAADLLRSLVRSVEDGAVYGQGDWTNDAAGYGPARFVVVNRHPSYMALANEMFPDPAGGPVAAVQVVFPDQYGRFYLEPDSYAGITPVLGDMPGAREGAEHILPRSETHTTWM
jgi:Domain of unknown function (DUF4262)